MFKQPLFTGELVRLAAPLPEDQDLFADWTTDDTYMRQLDDDPVRPLSPGHFGDFEAYTSSKESCYFHLRTLADDSLIGFVVLFNIKWKNRAAELAVGIGHPDYRGKGYGSDALRLILRYAFAELNLYRVGLSVMAYNTPAIRAYERAGLVREGVMRRAVEREGQRYDLVVFGILREDWEARQR